MRARLCERLAFLLIVGTAVPTACFYCLLGFMNSLSLNTSSPRRIYSLHNIFSLNIFLSYLLLKKYIYLFYTNVNKKNYDFICYSFLNKQNKYLNHVFFIQFSNNFFLFHLSSSAFNRHAICWSYYCTLLNQARQSFIKYHRCASSVDVEKTLCRCAFATLFHLPALNWFALLKAAVNWPWKFFNFPGTVSASKLHW